MSNTNPVTLKKKKNKVNDAETQHSSPHTNNELPVGSCIKCDNKGWYFVNEWIGNLQGRKDCICKK